MIKFILKNRKKSFSLKLIVKKLYRLPGIIIFIWNFYYCKIKGAQLDEFVCFERVPSGSLKKLKVGFGSFIAADVHLALHDSIVIGRNCVINSNVKLLTASHYVNDEMWGMYSKKITIGDYSWIAMNVLILPGVTIGNGAIIGAGSVVRINVPDYSIVLGNPAKVVGYREKKYFKYIPASFNSAIEAWIGSDVRFEE